MKSIRVYHKDRPHEAALWVDQRLIEAGMEPRNILKRQTL